MKIALDAGHGLKTAGKQTPDGIKEWEINDKVRDKEVEILKDYEVDIIYTDNDEGIVDESLTSRRVMYVNQKVDAFVSNHHNALKGKWGKHTGIEVYVDKNCTEKDMQLAETIYKKLVEYTGLKGRGIKKADFTVINQNKVPAVLVEGGFMDSTIDHPVITSEKGQDAYARAVAEGLIEFLGLKKKAKKTSKYINNERVKSWQVVMNKVYKCGLDEDSNFGPDCEKKSNKHQLYYRRLFVMKNDHVLWLQNRLYELGYKIDRDRKFGPKTKQVVEQFQRDRRLDDDGYVGTNTTKELLK